MIQIRKVLYLNSDNTYLSVDHETIIVKIHDSTNNEDTITRLPATLIEQIVIFGSTNISSNFIKFCVDHHITVSFVSYYGAYYGRTIGKTNGNILLRKLQYDLFNDNVRRLSVVKNIILGKCLNQISALKYYMHDATSSEANVFADAIKTIQSQLCLLQNASSLDAVRGYEGVASSAYFTAYNKAVHPTDDAMSFVKRSKRPPENFCNAMLSFLYTMLHLSCISALETFGLDSYLGFLHEMRPGRESLAADLIEEFRAPLVDKFVSTLINRKQFQSKDFTVKDGNIRLVDASRKRLLELWEAEKNTTVFYPLTGKEVPIKTLPYLQAQLLAQFIRGDISAYPPFHWEWKC